MESTYTGPMSTSLLKMKEQIIFIVLLTLTSVVFASSKLKQTISHIEKPLSVSKSDSEIKLVTNLSSDNTNSEQNTVKNKQDSKVNTPEDEDEVDIIIVDQSNAEDEVISQAQSNIIEDMPYVSLRDTSQEKINDEIMETAEGFVPIRIFKRKKNSPRPSSRVATRRYLKRHPYRKFYFYPYYAFYRPSSLRYY